LKEKIEGKEQSNEFQLAENIHSCYEVMKAEVEKYKESLDHVEEKKDLKQSGESIGNNCFFIT